MRHFEKELEQLKCRLLEMSSLVESALYDSIAAAVQKDRARGEGIAGVSG